mmetsp:Transcript_25997/g.71320  ORF Transcript_25997/g.71320 Transcript_25997/m.71320 type:complete len:96 (-) Transcript_25997:118-405(-)
MSFFLASGGRLRQPLEETTVAEASASASLSEEEEEDEAGSRVETSTSLASERNEEAEGFSAEDNLSVAEAAFDRILVLRVERRGMLTEWIYYVVV